MKILWAAILFFAATPNAFAEPLDQQSMKQAFQRDAQHCADMALKHDYPAFVDCWPQRFVLRGGGRDRAISAAKIAIEQLVAEGFHKESTTYEQPGEIHDGGKFYYAVLHGRSVMNGTVGSGPTKGRRGRFEYDDYELGISEDQGRSWKMMQLSDKLFAVYPELIGKVQIPAWQRPVLLNWLPNDKAE